MTDNSPPTALIVEPRYKFLLIDQFKKEVKARIDATQSTIDMLNKPEWMKSRGWKYIREDQTELTFDFSVPLE